MNFRSGEVTSMNLFRECFSLSMFSFGGGSTIISLLQQKFVEELKWIDESSMLEMITIAQSTPGATSVNTAILIGYDLLGLKGALISAAATSLPPLIVITIITLFFDKIRSSRAAADALKAVRACAAALVASVSLSLLTNLLRKRNYFLIAVWICVTFSLIFLKINTLALMLSGLVCGVIYSIILVNIQKKVHKS